MKITFNPHIVGMGHRARSNLIAGKLKQIEPKIKIKFLLREDDLVPPDKWLDFDYVKGKWRRSFEVVTSSCLVEDGALIQDFRLKILSKLGGKVVAIVRPFGFKPDYATIMHRLNFAHLIIVHWPEKLFRWPEELSSLGHKVRRVEPIFYEPKSEVPEDMKKEADAFNVYVSISTETEKIFPVIEDAVRRLKDEIPNLKLNFSSSYKDFKDVNQHIKTIMSSDIVIAMGMGTTFESCYLGTPRVCISLPWSEEETTTGKMLEQEGAAFSIPLNELGVENITEVIYNIYSDPSLRNELITRGRKLVPKSGLDDAAHLILNTIS